MSAEPTPISKPIPKPAPKPAPMSAPMPSDLSDPWLEHAPLPMAAVEGATHIVRHINPAFCRLIDKARDELVGKPFREILPDKDDCAAMLDRVYRTGASESHLEQEPRPRPVFSSYTMWPVMADGRAAGVVVQVIEIAPLHERALAMNEALLLGSLRQHELTAAADSSNVQLQAEIGERKRSEREALLLTDEVSHRVKNNLQTVVALIGYEARSAAAACVPGYEAMQARIGAIAELYDLISQSSRGQTVAVDAYLTEIARTMSASLLGGTSAIDIVSEAEALEIDAVRAVPFGLLVNELGTNAIKHAFPGGTGRLMLGARRVADQMELTVADDGVGMKEVAAARTLEKHGADYVAIFVRQLGGTILVSGSEGRGTTVRIRLPLRAVPPEGGPRA
jgi:two-component sensor histidine kinase